MARLPNKYERGSTFDSLDAAYEWMYRGLYFWWNDRPYHPSFLTSWQFRMFANLVKRGSIVRAKITGAWIAAAVDDDVRKLETV